MTALILKVIACITMLIDHIGYCTPGATWMRIIGRLAFPIYVFLLTEGYCHTSNRLRYGLRLLLFAVLAQVPFGLMVVKDPFYPEGSVMVTLLLSYLSVWLIDTFRGRKLLCLLSWMLVLGLCYVMHLEWIPCDYGARGVLLALAFYWLYPWTKQGNRIFRSLVLLAAAFCAVFYQQIWVYTRVLLNMIQGKPYLVGELSSWTCLQAFSLLSIPLILMYNGKRGWAPESKAGRKAMQYAFYAFYPIHMLILYFTIR